MTQDLSEKQRDLSLNEMLRMMDVATELRKQRETVEKEFAFDETKDLLRVRLMETTKITGESFTEQEVDAAIEQYFNTLHTFREPPASMETALAHLYVQRGHISIALLFVTAIAGVGWYLLHTAAGSVKRTLSQSRQTVQQSRSTQELSRQMQNNAKTQADELEASVRAMTEKIRAVALEADISKQIERLTGELDAAVKYLDVNSLKNVSSRAHGMFEQLNEEYEVRIVTGHNERSAISRTFEDEEGNREPKFYAIVEARDSNDRIVTRRIRNEETGKTEAVNRWAERIPKPVFDRLKEDKKSDGILNEAVFAVKQRGYLTDVVRLLNELGEPLQRTGQITNW